MKQSIYQKLIKITGKLTEILRVQEEILRLQKQFFDQLKGSFTSEPQDLINLPKHLQTTALALSRCEQASAIDISGITGKARANESHYLNILVGMGKAIKWREGQCIFFAPLKNREVSSAVLSERSARKA